MQLECLVNRQRKHIVLNAHDVTVTPLCNAVSGNPERIEHVLTLDAV